MSAGFSTLIPAFTLRVKLAAPISIGPSSKNPAGISIVDIPAGTLVSEPSYPLKINATCLNGNDYIKSDPTGAYLRLDVKSVLKDESGALIVLLYTGHIEFTEAIGKILSGASDAATVGFGNISTHVTFETGSPEFSLLEQRLYVGSGRVIVEEGGPVVEYKISQVQA